MAAAGRREELELGLGLGAMESEREQGAKKKWKMETGGRRG